MKNRTIFGLLLFAFGFVCLFTACNKELFTADAAPVKLDPLQQVVEERAGTFTLDVLNPKAADAAIHKKVNDIITYTGVINGVDNAKAKLTWLSKKQAINPKPSQQAFELNIGGTYFSIDPGGESLDLAKVVPTVKYQAAHHIIPIAMATKPQNQSDKTAALTAARLIQIAGLNGFHINASINGIALYNTIVFNSRYPNCVERTFHANAPQYDKMVTYILERWIKSLIDNAPGGSAKSPFKNYNTDLKQAKALAPIINKFLQGNLIPFLRAALTEAQRKTINGEMDASKKVSYCSKATATLNNHYKFWNIDVGTTPDAELANYATINDVQLFYSGSATPNTTGQ
jgi:hypothetical protein